MDYDSISIGQAIALSWPVGPQAFHKENPAIVAFTVKKGIKWIINDPIPLLPPDGILPLER